MTLIVSFSNHYRKVYSYVAWDDFHYNKYKTALLIELSSFFDQLIIFLYNYFVKSKPFSSPTHMNSKYIFFSLSFFLKETFSQFQGLSHIITKKPQTVSVITFSSSVKVYWDDYIQATSEKKEQNCIYHF